jgi:rubrerythrin
MSNRQAERIKERAMSEIELGISVASNCYTCTFIGEDCPECMDLRETNLTVLAHELVDEGNDVYRYAPMYASLTTLRPEANGHEWVGAQTRVKEHVREEYLPPVTDLTDRAIEPGDEAMIDLVTVRPNEKVCNWCNLTFYRKLNDCPSCEEAEQYEVANS